MLDVVGFEGLYAVTSDGRIYSHKQKRFLKPFVNTRGYLQIGLSKKNKKCKFLMHRLVALHFIPNPDEKDSVHHRDHNRHNNRLSNLEWVTVEENNSYNYYQPVKPEVAF